MVCYLWHKFHETFVFCSNQVSFCRQFYGSLNKADYMALRHGFVVVSLYSQNMFYSLIFFGQKNIIVKLSDVILGTFDSSKWAKIWLPELYHQNTRWGFCSSGGHKVKISCYALLFFLPLGSYLTNLSWTMLFGTCSPTIWFFAVVILLTNTHGKPCSNIKTNFNMTYEDRHHWCC